MRRTDPAGLHFHSFWADHSKNPDHPLWLRLASLAYSSHHKNGHATFFLGGESTLPEVLQKSRRHIQKEIQLAIDKGFLAKESNINCLVLPDEICGGAEGNAFAECKLHRH